MKPTNIKKYILLSPNESQKKLHEIYKAIRSVAKDAEEGLKWSMPAFWQKRILVTFAAFKNHIGFYPTPSAVSAFKQKLMKYKTAKGSIQFPLNKPLPIPLIKAITKFRIKELLENGGMNQ
jgi:uncharacterized protein YdhG (YjbR/CyaY superfamily)